MKTRHDQTPGKNIPMPNNKHRPENKDDLDSREGEEQLTKGDDVTHNKKDTKEHHLKEKNKRK